MHGTKIKQESRHEQKNNWWNNKWLSVKVEKSCVAQSRDKRIYLIK